MIILKQIYITNMRRY